MWDQVQLVIIVVTAVWLMLAHWIPDWSICAKMA
jgi:hypothetical protein